MRYFTTKILIVLLLPLLMAACSGSDSAEQQHRAVYYWRTTMNISPAERQFISQHAIDRLYLRYFDVVPQADGPTPNATLAFNDSAGVGTMPDDLGVEIIPVVFIHNDCMREDAPDLAGKIFRRVMQISETHGVKPVKELQIDCDWTMQTRQRFFKMMEEMRRLCHDSQLSLSATIRLHQLTQPVPPVDRGVLMVYNTGDVTRLDVEKPILDIRDVSPYLHALGGYKLPLSGAYPLFTWKLLFRANRFVGIIHSDDNLPILPGDSIVVRQPALSDIIECREAVGRERSDVNQEIILYDLNPNSITRLNPHDYEAIYRP